MQVVKAAWCAPLLFSSFALADQVADRLAIGRVIALLNEPSQRNAAFAASGYGRAEFDRLRRLHPRAFRIVPPSRDAASPLADHPTVTISHEPWGEATIDFPGPMRGAIVFIASGVALAEGACTFEDEDGGPASNPLLFVMKKEGDNWKIASLRVLAPR